jgi:hypothetical protein
MCMQTRNDCVCKFLKIRFFLGPTFVSKRVGRAHLKLKFFFLNFSMASLVPNEYLDTKWMFKMNGCKLLCHNAQVVVRSWNYESVKFFQLIVLALVVTSAICNHQLPWPQHSGVVIIASATLWCWSNAKLVLISIHRHAIAFVGVHGCP